MTHRQAHTVLGEVRLLPALKYTDMTNTLTLKQRNAQEELFRLKNWEVINTFVALTFDDTKTRKRVLTALESTPMDFDYKDWQGIVDFAIRKFL